MNSIKTFERNVSAVPNLEILLWWRLFG